MDDALAEMAERLGSENFAFVLTAVTIQRQVGGSLAGLFDMVADTVRQRQQFARKIKALTAMGRMSAYVLIGLPFFVAGALTLDQPGRTWRRSSTRPPGHKLIIVGLVMMASAAPSSKNRLLQGVTDAAALSSPLCLVASVSLVGELVTLPARERKARSAAPPPTGAGARRPSGRGAASASGRSAAQATRSRGRAPPEPEADGRDVTFRLLCAGMSRRVSPTGFLAAKGMLLIGGIVFGVLIGAGSTMSLFCSRWSSARRLHRPGHGSSTQRAKRGASAIRGELPDALDLLAVWSRRASASTVRSRS